MDSRIGAQDFQLLAQDPLTFAVLDRILRGPCDLVLTDHRSVILCHSDTPHPVWIWTPDGCAGKVKQAAWDLADAYRPLSGGYRINMKPELADFFISRGKQAGLNVGIAMQMFVYDCPFPIRPEIAAEGQMRPCAAGDAEEAADLLAGFYTEIGDEIPPLGIRIEKARAYIDDQAFFFWEKPDGITTACCSLRRNRGLASIGSVYTLPAFRRMHYALNLVYAVTQRVLEMGYRPMLYTDAGYPASNECYRKVGYVLRGRLCSVALAKS